MIDATVKVVDSWEEQAQISISDQLHVLTLDIVTRCLLGSSLGDNYEKMKTAVNIGNEFLTKKIRTPLYPPFWVPMPATLHYKKHLKYANQVILDIIAARQQDDTQHQDLLSMLMHTKDADTGESMTPQQLRDEVVTIFVAGHETTSNALSWIFYLLSQHPDKLRLVQQEIDEVLQGNLPTFETLKALTYTQMVIEEGMRVYPSVWMVGRRAVNDTQIGDYHFKKNAVFFLDIFSLHKNPDFWEEPDQFKPERFSPELKKKRHKYAYIPFGAGQRMCIGNNFALMEMQIVLAIALQKYEFPLAENCPPVELQPLVTLKPKNSILVDLKKRS